MSQKVVIFKRTSTFLPFCQSGVRANTYHCAFPILIQVMQ